jgi:hypothetical protein
MGATGGGCWGSPDATLFGGLAVTTALQVVFSTLFALGSVVQTDRVSLTSDGYTGSIAAMVSLQCCWLVWSLVRALVFRKGCARQPLASRVDDEDESASPPARRATLSGAIAAYLAIVLTFASAYSLLVVVEPKSFSQVAVDYLAALNPARNHSINSSSLSVGEMVFTQLGVGPLGTPHELRFGPPSEGAPDAVAQWQAGVGVLFVMLFFSVETQALVGLGDTIPTHPWSQCLSIVQEVVGVGFSIIIISQVLPALGTKALMKEARKKAATAPSGPLPVPASPEEGALLSPSVDDGPLEESLDLEALTRQTSAESLRVSEDGDSSSVLSTNSSVSAQLAREERPRAIAERFHMPHPAPPPTWLSSIVHDATVSAVRHWARRRLVLVTLLLQVVVLAVLVSDPAVDQVVLRSAGAQSVAPIAVAIVLQVIQVAVIVATSLKFVHYAWSLTVSAVFQAYLSLAIAFSGIYLLEFLLVPGVEAFAIPPRAWESLGGGEAPMQALPVLVSLAFEFLYFSLSIQTTVGFGDVVPTAWYSRLACMCHILISVLFNGIVLGYGLANIGEARRRREELKRSLRRKGPVPVRRLSVE